MPTTARAKTKGNAPPKSGGTCLPGLDVPSGRACEGPRRVSVHGARGLALTGTVGRSDTCALVAFASLATALSSRPGDHRPRGSAPAGRTRARQKFQLPAHAQRVDARRANGLPRPLVYCPVTSHHAPRNLVCENKNACLPVCIKSQLHTLPHIYLAFSSVPARIGCPCPCLWSDTT